MYLGEINTDKYRFYIFNVLVTMAYLIDTAEASAFWVTK